MYNERVKNKLPNIDPNGRVAKFGEKLYDESVGFFLDNAPNPYKIGCKYVLKYYYMF